jgi:hypothetical protein
MADFLLTDDASALARRRAFQLNTEDVEQPDYVRPELMDRRMELQLIDDLMAGTRRMHRRSTSYIRKWKDEEESTYAMRRQGETLFGGFRRTLSAAIGMLFAKAPNITWNAGETTLRPHWDAIDGRGTKGDVLIKRFAGMALRDGLALVLVDFPRRPETAPVTLATERALGLRPRWAIYPRHRILNWRTQIVDNREVLSMVVLHEIADAPDGRYGTLLEDRYRVVYLNEQGVAAFTLWARDPQSGSTQGAFVVRDEGVFLDRSGAPRATLPVAVAYTGHTEQPLMADIPLMDVAWANLSHWQIATDLRFNRSVAGFEQLVVSGQLLGQIGPDGQQIPGALKIGPLVAIQVEQGGTVTWQSPVGGGLQQLQQGAMEKLTEMAQQGLSFLQTDTRAAETAEAKRLDASAENATLATAAQGIEDAINAAWEIHGWYEGMAPIDCPVVSISRDYEATTMPAQLLAAYVQAVAQAGLPVRLLLAQMQQGGLIAPDEDLDVLAGEMMAEQEARAEQAALDREANMAAVQNTATIPEAA